MLLNDTSAPITLGYPVFKANYKQTIPRIFIKLPANPHRNEL